MGTLKHILIIVGFLSPFLYMAGLITSCWVVWHYLAKLW